MFPFSESESDIHSTAASLFSVYASFTALMMMIKTVPKDIIPASVQSYLQYWFSYITTPIPSSTTIIIDDVYGMSRNEIYDAAELYLGTKITVTTKRFKVNKTVRQKRIQMSVEKNEEIRDTFEGIELRWRFFLIERNQNGGDYDYSQRFFELSFNKKYRERVVNEYLPHVLAKAKEMKDKDKVVKLYHRQCYGNNDDDQGQGRVWRSVNLEHPATFGKLAMDLEMKKAVIDDLERFVTRRDYYKKVGKAWKRGYLLYGPPGTGKSSLVAAMANYLKFDVYDLELTNVYSNSELRSILVSTTNRSIIVIEDIDCAAQTQDRGAQSSNGSDLLMPNLGIQPYYRAPETKLTLSGLLNFIDGLWSSCGDERIIIFTTNHKEKLDPALLRPGRMDMHIHMSYCSFEGFKQLASNYLGVVDEHRLYGEIEELLGNVNVTPAEIAEELMKNEDADIAVSGVLEFLKRKKKDIACSGVLEFLKRKKKEGEEEEELMKNEDGDIALSRVLEYLKRKRKEGEEEEEEENKNEEEETEEQETEDDNESLDDESAMKEEEVLGQRKRQRTLFF